MSSQDPVEGASDFYTMNNLIYSGSQLGIAADTEAQHMASMAKFLVYQAERFALRQLGSSADTTFQKISTFKTPAEVKLEIKGVHICFPFPIFCPCIYVSQTLYSS